MVSPASAGLCDGLEAAAGGLEAAVDGDGPPQAAANIIEATAVATKSFACTHPYTWPGYGGNSYSAVTYAAVIPPSTTNVEPLT